MRARPGNSSYLSQISQNITKIEPEKNICGEKMTNMRARPGKMEEGLKTKSYKRRDVATVTTDPI